ncbi:MAG: hypothetical protein ACRECO_19105 [Xanthobacteraceae bacterium]
MRRMIFALAAIAALSAGLLVAGPAAARTPAAPAALADAITATSTTQNVAWRCTHWWNGRWHRHSRCFWAAGPRIYFGHRAYLGPRLHFGHRHFRHHRHRFRR